MGELQRKRNLLLNELEKQNMSHIFEEASQENSTTFRTIQDLHQGRCTMYVDIDESIFSTITIFFATLDNIGKKEKMLQLINDLNMSYKSSKYFIDDSNELGMTMSYASFADKFDAEVFVNMIFTAYNTIKNNDYAKFMRIMWS